MPFRKVRPRGEALHVGRLPSTGGGAAQEIIQRRGQIDALRAIAILCVCFDHFTGYEGIVNPGVLGLRFFLVASGYLVTIILLRAEGPVRPAPVRGGRILMAFYIRRVLRIWPAWMLTLAVAYCLAEPEDRHYFLWHLTFMSNFLFARHNDFDLPWTLCHLWTLSVQEQFYLVWPLFVLFLPRRYLAPVIGATIAASIVFRIVMTWFGLEDHAAAYTLPFASFDALGVGAGLALLHQRPRLVALLGAPRPLLILALGLAAWLVQWLSRGTGTFLLSAPLWLVPLALLLHGAYQGFGGTAGRLLDSRLLQHLGKISLGIYLYHVPLWDLIGRVYGHFVDDSMAKPGPWAFVVGTLITILVADALWKGYENPINALKRHFPYRPRNMRKAQAMSGGMTGTVISN